MRSTSNSSFNMLWASTRFTFFGPLTRILKFQYCISPAPPLSSTFSSAPTFLNFNSLAEISGANHSVASSSHGEFLQFLAITSNVSIAVETFYAWKVFEGIPQRSDFTFWYLEMIFETDTVEAYEYLSMKSLLDSIEPRKDLSSIKILSYNVWFREDLEMQERMEEIGDLIHLHSPHIICLQEVTPDIYDIFQSSSWWRIYQCSISRKMAYTKAYFCMLLSKLPVKSFIHKPFSNTKMGRELCIAEVEVKPDKSLVVATSHLESPCPGPPKWDQMYSKERVAQAKESINLLKEHRNVVFGGDMNWDEKVDGQFPFPEGWVDAWLDLRPTEKGYTYDTKSNKMISGNKTLQKRLDRFICNLKDFKISGIEIVGSEEIPGLSYYKEKKSKNGVEKLLLPVLPSDHYGLLLTITKL